MTKCKAREGAIPTREAAPARRPEKPSAAEKAIIVALEEWRKPLQPRTRMPLRAAMRRIGLDEWKIAWLLNFKIHLLAESCKSSDNKLLLDYLKEAARHLDPASARAAAMEGPPIQAIQEISRPEQDEPAAQ